MQWQLPGLRLSLQVDNLFDCTWYASAYNNAWVTPGEPRRMSLAVRKEF